MRKGEGLQLTDKEFYLRRIRQEFKNNKHLTTTKDKTFCYNVSLNFNFFNSLRR